MRNSSRNSSFKTDRLLSCLTLISSLSLGVLPLGAAQAQTVSPVTVTPQSLAPEQRDTGFRVAIPEAGALHAPAGAEALTVTLGDVVLDGGFGEVKAQTDAVLAQLRGQKVSLAQIYDGASRIEAIHARSGYVLARVSVPPQNLRDGAVLHLTVTDGFIESVDVSGLPRRARAAVLARTHALQGRRHITLARIERPLLTASEVPGLTLRSTLMRGSQPGGTKLVLEGEHQLLSGSLSADNSLDPSLGRWGETAQVALNSALGLGEQVYGFAASNYDLKQILTKIPQDRVLGGGVIVPLGSGWFSLNPEATFSRTAPAPQPGAPRTLGVLRRLTLRANATLLHTRLARGGLSLSVEQLAESNHLPDFATLISRDRYLAARLGGTYNRVTADGAQYGAALQISQGLGGLTAISPTEARASGVPYSRQGAHNDFTKLVASAHADWGLDRLTRFSMSARGQYSFGQAVFRAEQFTLEGSDGLSAYVGGRTALDEGAVVRGELSHLLQPDGAHLVSGLTPYAFAAFGAGRLNAPTVAELPQARISAFNLGAGAHATLLGRLGVSVEYARGISDYAPLDKANRVNVSVMLRF